MNAEVSTHIESRQPSPLRDVFFLDSLSTAGLALIIVLTVLVSMACAAGLVFLQSHLAKAGDTTGLTGLLAGGSSVATVWPGWIASAFFFVSIVRLRGAPEPPTGRRPVEQLSISEIRHALASEYRAVRLALSVVTVLAMVDVERFAGVCVAAARGAHWAISSMTFTGAEAFGWLLAAVLLGTWALTFRGQLETWGAV